MRWALTSLTALAFSFALVPGPQALAKPRGCFTKSEQTAEEIVRYGLRLREGAMGCDGAPWEAHTQPLWEAVDKQFGPQFKQQTDAQAHPVERADRLLLPQLPAITGLLR
jgi:hypothetical protein